MLFLLFTVAFALAPLHTVKEPRDRDGLREYIVLLSSDAPRFGHDVEKLRDWVKQDLSVVDPSKINEIWSIGTNFSAFPAWLSPEGVRELRQHSYTELIEENQRVSIDPREMDTTNVVTVDDPATLAARRDWGSMRSNEPTNYLQTDPEDLFTADSLDEFGYPYGGDSIDDWDWDGPVWNPINRGINAFVYVIDTGINYLHQEFINLVTGLTRVTVRVDCSGDDTPASCVPATVANGDVNGHGSHCAGTCCGNYRGMAPDCGIGMVRIFNDDGEGFSTWTLRGISYVANHQQLNFKNIASMSVGGGVSMSLNAGVNAAFNAGVLVVVAAGNDGDDASNYSPASAALAITVGATDALDQRADFSNYGAKIGVFAPGVQIHSAWMTTDPSNPNVYNTIDGTSMATPNVAGSMALYFSRTPNASPTSAKSALYYWSIKGIVVDSKSPAENNRFIYAQFKASLDAQNNTKP